MRPQALLVTFPWVLAVACDWGGSHSFTPTPSPRADIIPSINRVSLSADCRPPADAERIGGQITVDYRNDGAQPGSLDGLRAEAIFATPTEERAFPLTLMPTSSGDVDPGATLTFGHAAEGESDFECSLCSDQLLEPGDFVALPGTVSLTWVDASGEEITAVDEVLLQCTL